MPAPRIQKAATGTELPDGRTVHDSCGGRRGGWLCTTHDEHFENQLQKDFHIQRGSHVLAWICVECGNIETP